MNGQLSPRYKILARLQSFKIYTPSDHEFLLRYFYPENPEYIACWYDKLNLDDNSLPQTCIKLILNLAAKLHNTSLVKYLIDQKNILPSRSTLEDAALSGNKNLVKWLIDNHSIAPDIYTLIDATLSSNL